MANNFKVRIGKLALRTVTSTDADGQERTFVAHPIARRPLFFRTPEQAARSTGDVLADNFGIEAQPVPLNRASGALAQYGIAIARAR